MAKRTKFDLLRGYVESDVEHSGKKFYVNLITGSSGNATFTRVGRFISAFGDRLTRFVSYTRSNVYGLVFLIFGILSLVLSFVQTYVEIYSDEIPLYYPIISVAFALLSIPFLLSEKPLAILIQDVKITDFIFFEFFCIRRMHRDEKEKGAHVALGVVFGVLLAVLGLFVPLWIIAVGIGIAVYLFLTFLSPEFSFFSIFLAMPYLTFDSGGIFLAIMVAITIVSYARKVALGKRVYFFEQYDFSLGFMLTCILISGIFVKGTESFVSSVVMILLGMGYLLASSLVTNRRLADCLINAVITSSVPVSVIAIVESVRFLLNNSILEFEGATATFEKPSTLAIFLLLSAAFSIYFVESSRHKSTKCLYFMIFLLNFAALVSSKVFWAFGAAMLGMLAFGVLKLRRGWRIFLFMIAVLPYGLLFVPVSYLEPVINHPLVSALGFSEAMSSWHVSLEIVKDNLMLGIGIGEECFIEEMAKYRLPVDIFDSGSFLLEIACEAGIISLAAFLLILAIRLKHRAIYRSYTRNSNVNALSEVTSVAVVLFLVYGIFNYVWADMTMYYLFWCVFGLGSAILRISKQEFDDRVAYFSDGSAEDSSSIDITIR